jgi:hypothetical protein
VVTLDILIKGGFHPIVAASGADFGEGLKGLRILEKKLSFVFALFLIHIAADFEA